MAGTLHGGKKAAATNRSRYGDDFYKVIGKAGGLKGGGKGGFATMTPEERKEAGRKGGAAGKKYPKLEKYSIYYEDYDGYR